jgi:small-conductance mechanosensitive channel
MDRRSEWFVPKFGPERFRVAVGILFLPYTGMVLSYTVIGSMLAEKIYWDRVGAILAIYFLALGIGAHALDAIGSKKVKPWGTVFSPKPLWISALVALILAYAIGIYYMVLYTPVLWIIAILEGFFLLAYNLELFGGRFHTDEWFVFCWGFLPVLAGYVIQTNSGSLPAFILGLAAGLLSYVQISAERPYKDLKRLSSPTQNEIDLSKRYERILKSISIGTILLGLGMVIWRWGY